MPKKTRQQKNVSAIRRQRAVLQVKSTPQTNEKGVPEQELKLARPKLAPRKVPNEYDAEFVEYTKRDLLRTLGIATFLFSLEFGIFYATLKGVSIVRF